MTFLASLHSGIFPWLVRFPLDPSRIHHSHVRLVVLAAVNVQGKSIPLGNSVYAAIDTGTSNIAAPASAIQTIYSQIPGSKPATGTWAGYYQYRTLSIPYADAASQTNPFLAQPAPPRSMSPFHSASPHGRCHLPTSPSTNCLVRSVSAPSLSRHPEETLTACPGLSGMLSW